MTTFASMIADAATMGPNYAKRLLNEIPADRFARLASPGGQAIQANHPAFILGHLCLYPQRVLQHLGLDPAEAAPPESYEALFSKTASCQDDPEGTIYPPADEIVAQFERTYAAAIAALRSADDALLEAENPMDTPMKKVCTTLGSLLNFYMTGHVMTHLGQLSSWRRMEGLPAC